MAYVQPNSNVKLLSGIPLARDLSHTVFFSSKNLQTATFDAYAEYDLDEYNYQRTTRGTIQVHKTMKELLSCNYMVFKNTNTSSTGAENKWYYAFIDNFEYVNPNCTEIYYTIDPIQTYWFDIDIPPCFVEREHTTTDVLYGNLVPENIDAGNYTTAVRWNYLLSDTTTATTVGNKILIKYVPNVKYIYDYSEISTDPYINIVTQNKTNTSLGTIKQGVYTGYDTIEITYDVRDNVYSAITATRINKVINTIVDECKGTVISLSLVPSYLLTNNKLYKSQLPTYDFARQFFSATTETYTPKNKKMYIYPYKKLVVSNNFGTTKEYKWEYFNGDGTVDFNIDGIISPEIKMLLYPSIYNNISNDYEDGVEFNEFINYTWNEDSFTKWWNINKESVGYSTFSTALLTALGIGLAAYSGGASIPATLGAVSASKQVVNNISSITAGALEIGNSLTSLQKAKNLPDELKGTIGGNTLKFNENRNGFTFYDMGCEASTAKIIDDYFSKYGYAIKSIKRPNVKSSSLSLRPYWNYIETKDCIVTTGLGEGIPKDMQEIIQNAFNKGITFWMSFGVFGNYSYDNRPES